jgi:hypothetical protein
MCGRSGSHEHPAGANTHPRIKKTRIKSRKTRRERGSSGGRSRAVVGCPRVSPPGQVLSSLLRFFAIAPSAGDVRLEVALPSMLGGYRAGHSLTANDALTEARDPPSHAPLYGAEGSGNASGGASVRSARAARDHAVNGGRARVAFGVVGHRHVGAVDIPQHLVELPEKPLDRAPQSPRHTPMPLDRAPRSPEHTQRAPRPGAAVSRAHPKSRSTERPSLPDTPKNSTKLTNPSPERA